LFQQAIDVEPARLTMFLDEQCGGNTELRAAVEELVRLDQRAEQTESLLRGPVAESRLKASAAAPLPSIARYRLVRVLGEGGMGTVYEAEQDNPRRTVALKVIRPGLVSPALLRRFAQEAQILGLLHHPGIATIYEASVAADGRPFFAMELIRGVPLDEYARRHGLDCAARLELLARVCDAVQHAHEHGVVHRDLKPTNLLVDEAGQPRVLDFGVARGLDDQLRASMAHTQPGQLVGTPWYMSPEQVAADPNLDRRSDVYTLGVILFELLVGRLPYPVEQLPLAEAVWLIRVREPARLGALDRRLRGDVETIVARALEKEPGRRYPSAAELADDIRRHLAHEPIRARPPSPLYRLGKLARRHKALVATTAVFLAVLLVAGAVTAWQAVRAERDEAVRQVQRSQEVHDALDRAAALREQARESGDAGKWAEALAVARRAEALAEGGPVAPGLGKRVANLLRDLDDEEADRRVVARLEEVRLLQAEVDARESRFTPERALPEYRQVFADYGLRVGGEPAEAAARIRRRPAGVQGPVVAALDDWLDLARPEKAAEASWLERVLAAADPDDWRQRMRAARGRRDRRALLELAREVKVAAQPPQALFLLGNALFVRGSPEGAVELLLRAWDAYPGDFWINHGLGFSLRKSQPPQLDEAIPFLTVAVALRPRSPGAHLNLGTALLDRGQVDQAIACFKKARALDPKYAAAHNNLGNALRRKGKVDEAIACYKKAIAIEPKLANGHNGLGAVLCDVKRDYDGAIACFHQAIALDPKYALAHHNLGKALRGKGEVDRAITCFRTAIACYQKARAFDRSCAAAHYSLGAVLCDVKKDYDGAIACFRAAIALAPKHAQAHYNLANALKGNGEVDDAIDCYRTAIELDPKHAEAHCNLGFALARQGRFAESLAAVKRGHELGSKQPGWRYPSARWVRQAEENAALEAKLPAFLKGEFRPGDNKERLALAVACQARKLHHAAAGLYATVFAAEGRLAGAFGETAARSAALAGCGQSKDSSGLSEEQRARLRQQALTWLRAALEAGPSPLVLRRWTVHPSLAGVRDAGPLAELAAAERAGWQKLWDDVAAALAKARSGK
jgi:tetratricopeptide (TPR) repeat protein/predicted Ser/Thr protein kinase